MPGKLAVEVRPINRPRSQDLINAAVLLGVGIGKTPSKELLHSAIPIDKPIPMGHDCTRCAAVASCSLLNLASKNNGDNPITRRIKAIQDLKSQDPYFMEKLDEKTREAVIRQKMKPTPQPNSAIKIEREPEARPETKIKYFREIPTPTPAQVEPEKKPVEPKINKVEATPPVKLPIKIPRERIKTEVPVKPVEKPNNIELHTPRELPQALITRFRQRRISENKEAQKPQKVLETFKNKVNEFFTKVVKLEVRSVKEIPVKQSSVSVKKGRVQRIFDRLIHFERMRKKPPIEELKKGPDKIDFSKPLKLGSLTLLPLSKVDRKFKPRRLSFFSLIKLVNKQPKTKIETKGIGTLPIKVFAEKVKEALLKEKLIPFALIILPASSEPITGNKIQEVKDSHEIISVTEKTFFKLISLSTKLSRAISYLSLKENRRVIEKLLTIDVENILPSQEETQTTIKTYAYNMGFVLSYIARALLFFNNNIQLVTTE